jgi:hypothetical protein
MKHVDHPPPPPSLPIPSEAEHVDPLVLCRRSARKFDIQYLQFRVLSVRAPHEIDPTTSVGKRVPRSDKGYS